MPKQKPAKPYPDYPLFPHANGQWCKKVRGKAHYFGAWADPDAALEHWLSVRDELLAGIQPRAWNPDAYTVRDLCNDFIVAKKLSVATGELSPENLLAYRKVTDAIVKVFGKERIVDDLQPSDFSALKAELSKTASRLSTLDKFLVRARSVFGFAYTECKIDRPLRFGSGFTVSHKAVRRQTRGDLSFSAAEIRTMLDLAEIPEHKAYILLGVNAAFGPTDVAALAPRHIQGDVIALPRPKTGATRKAIIWPETAAALAECKLPFKVPGDVRAAIKRALAKIIGQLPEQREYRSSYFAPQDIRDGSSRALWRHDRDKLHHGPFG